MKILIYFILILNNVWAKPPGSPASDPDDRKNKESKLSPPANPVLSGNFEDNLKVVDKFLEKSFIHKPGIDINSYTGEVKTSFEIPLFVNNTSFKKLNFYYNSGFYNNVGFGLGFKLNIESILIRDDHTYQIEETGDDLVEIHFNQNYLPMDRLQFIFNQLNLKNVKNVIWLKTQSLENTDLYVKVNGDFGSYIFEMSLDGENKIFNNDGKLIRIFNFYNKGIKFQYEKGQISRIDNLDSNVFADFFYKSNLLERLDLRSDRLKIYNFTYSNNKNLLQVKLEKSLKSIFIGSYKIIQFKSHPRYTKNFPEKNQVIVFRNNDIKAEVITQSEEEFYLNLNSDNLTDKVVNNTKETFNQIKNYIESAKYICDEAHCSLSPSVKDLESFVLSRVFTYKFFIAVNGENGEVQYKENKNLAKNFKFTDLYSFENEDKYGFRPKIELKKIIRFSDLNYDGFKDLMICSYNKNLENLNTKIHKGKWFLSSQNQIASGVYLFLNKNDKTLFEEFDSNSITYVQKIDHKQMLTDTKNQIPLSEIISKNSNWEEISLNFPCHQGSIFHDFKNEGKISVLTGNTLTTINKNLILEKNKLNLEEIKNFFNPIERNLLLEDGPLDLVELQGNNKLDLTISYGNYIDPKTRELILIQSDNREIVIQRSPEVPLLIEEKSTYGQSFKVDYIYSPVGAIGKKFTISESEDDRKSYEKEYFYEGAKIHEISNTFLGFEKVTSIKKYIHDNTTTTVEKIVFDKDYDPSLLYTKARARKNGRILKHEIKHKFNSNQKLDLVDLKKYQYKDTVFENFDFFSDSRVSMENKFSLNEGQSVSEFETKLDGLFIPTQITEKTTGAQNHSLIKTEKLDIDYKNYTYSRSFTQSENENGKVMESPLEINYSKGLLIKSENTSNVKKYFYDNFGRLIRIESDEDQNPEIRKYSNLHLLDFPQSITKNGYTTKYDNFDLLTGNFSKIQIENEIPLFYKWNIDDVLTSIKKGETTLYELKEETLKNVSFKLFDQVFLYQIDSIGRFESLAEYNEIYKNWDRIWSKTFDFNGQLREQTDYSLNSANQSARTKFSFYPTGELVYKFQVGDTGAGKILEETKVKRKLEKLDQELMGTNYTATIINEDDPYSITSITEEWTDSVLGKVYHIDNYGEFSLNKESNQNLTGVKNLGLSYLKNHDNEVISSEKNNGIGWAKLERVIRPKIQEIEYSTNTFEKSIYDGSPYQFVSYNLDNSIHFKDLRNYELGKLKSKSLTFGVGLSFIEFYNYNPAGKLFEIKNPLLTKKFQYDAFDRIKSETFKAYHFERTLKYTYYRNNLTSIENLAEILYDKRNRIQQIKFQNGAKIEIRYDFQGKIITKKIDYKNGFKDVRYKRLRNGKILFKESNFEGEKREYNYKFDKLISNKSLKDSQKIRNEYSSLMKIDGINFLWNKNELREINQKNIFYTFNNEFVATCDKNNHSLENCFIKHSSDEYSYQNIFIKRVKIGQTTIGVFINEKFYPAITNHNDDLIGLLDEKGEDILFLRTFDDFGNKEKVIGNKNIEEKIPFTFGNLIELPGLKSRLLQSNSRIYVPEINEWASVDSELIWNPEVILNHPGNWNGLEYASGDSVNNLDVEGRFTKLITATFVGTLAFKFLDGILDFKHVFDQRDLKNEQAEFMVKTGQMTNIQEYIEIDKNNKEAARNAVKPVLKLLKSESSAFILGVIRPKSNIKNFEKNIIEFSKNQYQRNRENKKLKSN